MKKNYLTTIANFNCTFKYDNKTYGMLDYFESIIWPALNDKDLIRVAKSKSKAKTKFHLADIKLIKLDDGNIALVGKHIKRTLLDISPDYNKEKGFFGEFDVKPSAPYSTFIILLNNHRVVHFSNMSGAPDIRSLASTVREIINQYIKEERSKLKDIFIKNEYVFEGFKYKYIQEFSNQVLEKRLPYPELNIIPIESPELVKEYFEKISVINKVSFKFYKPNNEPNNFNNFFSYGMDMLEQTGSKSIQQTFTHPTENAIIEEAITSSYGKTNYTLDGKSLNNEPIQLTPDKVSEKFHIALTDDDDVTVELKTQEVYNQVKDKKIINETSEDNLNVFHRIYDYLISII